MNDGTGDGHLGGDGGGCAGCAVDGEFESGGGIDDFGTWFCGPPGMREVCGDGVS